MKWIVAFAAGLIAAPLLVVLAGLAGLLGSTATAEPPKWEVEVGERLLDSAIEKRARGLKNPIRPNDSAALAAGRDLYGDNCAGCHGDSTGPSAWGSRGFYPRAPQFWQARDEHEPLTPEEAYAAIHDGIRYSGMGAWRDLMKDEDIWKVANFVAGIHNVPSRAAQQKPRS
jgi:mono/diheme cytochrome c family protein